MKQHYVYGLFYEDEDENNVCFYIGSGKHNRINKHFYESQGGNNPHKDRKIKKLKRNGHTPRGIKLIENLSVKTARKIEQRLLNRDDIWENLTNVRRVVGEYSPGGKSPLNKEQAGEIRWLADHSNLTQKKIGKKYDITKKAVSHIKHEKSWNDIEKRRPSFYNGKKFDRTGNVNKQYSDEEVAKVKWLSKNTNKKYEDIGNIFGMNKGQVGKIKNEKVWSYIEPRRPKNSDWENLTESDRGLKGEDNPFYGKSHTEEVKKKLSKAAKKRTFKEKTKQKISKNNRKFSRRKIAEIKWLSRNSEMTQEEISSKYGVGKSTVSRYKREVSKDNIEPQQPKSYE